MKKFRYSIALIAAMMTMSCAKEMAPVQSEDNAQGINKTFTASFEEASTKALLKPGKDVSKVEWETTDQVSIFDGTSNVLYQASVAGETTDLTTEGTLAEAEEYYALYPYNSEAALADGVITTSLPYVQTAVEGSFATHLTVAHTTGSSFSFRNVCALIKVTVAVEGITEIVFRGNNDEYVAGGIKITVADEPVWAATTGYSRFVTLAAEEGQTLAAGDYYISVLPQTFEKGFSISAVHQDGTFATNYVTKKVVLERCDGIAGAFDANDTFGGSETNPYVLKTPEDLCSMYYLAIPEKEVFFELGNDINMEGVEDWIPVNYMGPFKKKTHFDGNDHTISNFTSPAFKYSSMFGVLYGSCKNVKFVDADITSDGESGCGVIGGYIGTTNLPATVENVSVTGLTVYGDNALNIGGLAGQMVGSTVKNCTISGLVLTGGEAPAETIVYYGGLIGQIKGVTSTLENCHVEGELNTESTKTMSYIGGLVGRIGDTADNSHTITYCSANVENNIETCAYAGGLLGGIYKSPVTVEKCSASGCLSGGNNVGGIVGYSENGTIRDCFTTCSVTSSGQGCGGIIGTSMVTQNTVERCYSTGDITTSRGGGGIVGLSTAPSITIKKCIAWNANISSSTTGANYYWTGAIRGGATGTNVCEDCWRRADMKLTTKVTANTLADSDNVNGTSTAKTAYHGKAAVAGATLSSVATSLGWSASTWDLTGAVPVLKAPVTE